MTNCTCSKCMILVPFTHMIADWDNELVFCVDCAIKIVDKEGDTNENSI